jgi:hypothetical protein
MREINDCASLTVRREYANISTVLKTPRSVTLSMWAIGTYKRKSTVDTGFGGRNQSG